MDVAVVTGSAGLVGSEAVLLLSERGFRIAGVDNNMRQHFFGPEASTLPVANQLQETVEGYTHHMVDVRHPEAVDRVLSKYGSDVRLIIHAAAQPSHDWAATDPSVDFAINAMGTLHMLEAARRRCPEAVFILASTNKVYGDHPNRLPLVEADTRWELEANHPYSPFGIPEEMPVDRAMHSPFGVSKLAADVLTQEYGRYFGLRTGVFRAGCITGPRHAGVELHGFLAYLAKCVIQGRHYTVFGYKGKQVRDQIHTRDLIRMFWHFYEKPRPGEVYNAGGGRANSCSVLEAIALLEGLSGRSLDWHCEGRPRKGDHMWWISDTRRFERHFPGYRHEHSLEAIAISLLDGLGT